MRTKVLPASLLALLSGAGWLCAQVECRWGADPGATNHPGELPVEMRWDRDYLYLRAEVSAAQELQWVIRPAAEKPGGYELRVLADGTMQATFFANAADPSLGKPVHVEGTGTSRGEGWAFEGRIAWAEFLRTGGRPAPDENWQVSVAGAPASQLRFAGPAMEPAARWKNTRLIGAPGEPARYRPQVAWPNLGAQSVVAVAAVPASPWMWSIEQQDGWYGPMALRRFRSAGDGADVETVLAFDDYAYSTAFHPRFAENGFVFIGVNGPRAKPPRTSRVVRYTVHDGRPDPASQKVIISWPSDGHNGAALAFGADGTLFVSSGDGSTDSDLDNRGQDTASLCSKILRLDVDHPAPGRAYSVPADNPFVGDGRFAPEVWAYGLRNPWRLTYDAGSGQLWAAENGQDLWEYARLIRRGANYGWSHYEGSALFRPSLPLGPQAVEFPTIEHSHNEFRSLSGGLVYRGSRFPELTGAYLYSDFGTGRLWAAKHDGKKLLWQRELCDTPFAVTHVTADAAGEVLLADYGAFPAPGQIYRLAAAAITAPVLPFPAKLSDSGLFADCAKLIPAAGVRGYEINAPAWHDGAGADYHLGLPETGALEITPTKSWRAPDGTALAQTLTLAGRRIETRVLLKQQNDWAGYTYLWNAAQTDADLAGAAGVDLEVVNHGVWRVPGRAECLMCHSRQANFALTLHEAQLNKGGQLELWERSGVLRSDPAEFERDRAWNEGRRVPGQAAGQRVPVPSALLPCSPERLRRFARLEDPTASLDLRARSYLGANCAHCHTRFGGGNSAMDFDWLLPLQKTHALDELPQHGTFGLPGARVIRPGDAGRSVLIPRVSLRGAGQMPPVGSRIPDPQGVRTLVEWIQAL